MMQALAQHTGDASAPRDLCPSSIAGAKRKLCEPRTFNVSERRSTAWRGKVWLRTKELPLRVSCCLLVHRSPGHHIEGGSSAVILVVRSATRWLR
jgi:hypothetical protein